jgi:hypothetical protein
VFSVALRLLLNCPTVKIEEQVTGNSGADAATLWLGYASVTKIGGRVFDLEADAYN